MSTVQVDTINESTTGSGVTVDGVLIKDGGIASSYITGGTGKILQVVSATSSTAQDTTSTSYVDITNLSVAITPSSTDNDILILYTDTTRTTRTNDVSSGTVTVQLLRDSTSIAVKQASFYNSAGGNGSNSIVQGEAISELDSPSTTSAITYKMQMKASSSTTISSQYGNSTASIIAMEIAG